MLGSSTVIDKCGVCGGQDSSCRKVTGSFQNATVTLGYHKILDIPAGARLINITERRSSPNYLGEMLHQMSVLNASVAQNVLNKRTSVNIGEESADLASFVCAGFNLSRRFCGHGNSSQKKLKCVHVCICVCFPPQPPVNELKSVFVCLGVCLGTWWVS